jgi:enoyl-CoA hydratase
MAERIDLTESVSYELDGDVAVIRLDDGKVNTIPPATVTALTEAFDRAEAEAEAVLLVGREGKLSAGFDLEVMTSGVEAMRDLVGSGARLLMRVYGSPLPVVVACTGHALAMGALLLLAADSRIGTDGPAKIGLNEVGIGMGLPVFAVELARERLDPRLFTSSVIQGRVFDPAGAVGAGYLDRLVAADAVEEAALEEARALAGLRRGAVRETKTRARGEMIERVLATLDEDMAATSAPRP